LSTLQIRYSTREGHLGIRVRMPTSKMLYPGSTQFITLLGAVQGSDISPEPPSQI
jgi:hypothetical protein